MLPAPPLVISYMAVVEMMPLLEVHVDIFADMLMVKALSRRRWASLRSSHLSRADY